MWHSVKVRSVPICIIVIQWLSVSFQDSTDAVPSDPSDRDQPTGDAPSLPLTVPATDDEVLEVLSPKRTVTPRTPTPRAPRAPREQMENLMREILEDASSRFEYVRFNWMWESHTGRVYETCKWILIFPLLIPMVLDGYCRFQKDGWRQDKVSNVWNASDIWSISNYEQRFAGAVLRTPGGAQLAGLFVWHLHRYSAAAGWWRGGGFQRWLGLRAL